MQFNKLCYLCLFTMLTFLNGCSNVKQDFQNARELDTVNAYESFISQYPDSKYGQWTSERIDLLNQVWEQGQQKKRARLKKSLNRFKKYKVDITSEENFLEDGWNARAPCLNKVGIVGFERKKQFITRYLIGTKKCNDQYALRGMQEVVAQTEQNKFKKKFELSNTSKWKPTKSAHIAYDLVFSSGKLKYIKSVDFLAYQNFIKKHPFSEFEYAMAPEELPLSARRANTLVISEFHTEWHNDAPETYSKVTIKRGTKIKNSIEYSFNAAGGFQGQITQTPSRIYGEVKKLSAANEVDANKMDNYFINFIWNSGAEHKIIGVVRLKADDKLFVFESDWDNPLVFRVDSKLGYVYHAGRGTVVYPSGKTIRLEQK